MPDRNETAREELFRIISTLEGPEDCRAFFEDLCTIKEIDDMAQRLETAVLLSRGESYSSVSREVGVSTTTISRVNRCLRYGSGGYRKALHLTEDNADEN